MKPQKKAVVAQKAQKTTATITKKRRASPDKFLLNDIKKIDKKSHKKAQKPEDTRKKADSEKKKLEQLEKKRRAEENKKKAEEKKKEKMEKSEDKKKLCKENDKKSEITDDKKTEKSEKIEENTNDAVISQANESNKKKNQKQSDEKLKTEKQQNSEIKRKNDKAEDKKKSLKIDENQDDSQKLNNSQIEENSQIDDNKTEVTSVVKKKGKDDKKKDGKTSKTECKENSKSPTTKEKKVPEVKKSPEKETIKKLAGTALTTTTTTTTGATAPSVSATSKKESKAKQQAPKKAATKRTVLAKKSHSPLAKKFIEKKLKLVKIAKGDEDNNAASQDSQNDGVSAAADIVVAAKSKKKNSIIPKSKAADKKPKLAKQMKVKLPQKNSKINNALKKAKIKKITEKIVASSKKKIETKKSPDDSSSDCSKTTTAASKEEPLEDMSTNEIKREICDDKQDEKSRDASPVAKATDNKKSTKSPAKQKIVKKPVKKATKSAKLESDQLSTKSEDVSLEDLIKQSKGIEDNSKLLANSKKEPAEGLIKIDLKVEAVNGDESCCGEASPTSASDSEDDYEEEIESRGRGKQKNVDRRGGKERESSPSDERARRMRLFGFWSGPKRHRVASLNALAKVHCLYENEAGGVYLGGFCKPKPEKEKPKARAVPKEDTKDDTPPKKPKEIKKVADTTKVEDNNKRNLRNVPGLRGKHWDMMESSSSSSSSSSDDDGERGKTAARAKKRNTTRRKKPEEVMDLKDMVVCKRMASLNASAILAASYSDEINRHGSSASDSSSESEVEVTKKRKQIDTDMENKRKSSGRQVPGDTSEEVIKPSKKVVIVNQDTDVTITGVYVNQTRSTHHEGFCSIAGMQYRISSTSHTQTAATAVAAELHEQQKPEQPCKSYTPLGALSSMQPPGSQGNHPNMSPRRHSAFSAPHQHGYYQPAGPLIQHPPTLPPVKAPPPEPTPTPPQNSEGSDDLVATSTTSGGTNSTGNSWRSFRKSESVTNAASSGRPSSSIVPSGGGFYRAYCPQYYGTPPQYPELCYPPTYSHPHAHPPYYKYAPTYRRQYAYGYPGADGGGATGGPGTGTGPGVVEYQAAPPPPGEYPMPPYYGGYPPPPPPPPPPPNPAYLHAQGRTIVDHAAFQGCPCPMQSCPKNVDTGPLIGNGKGAPVASGPGLSLPPSALVGPPSPARGLAGLAPPHGANAWDTDRVQLNTHRSNLNSQSQQQQIQPASTVHSIVAGAHSRAQNTECRTKDEKNCTENKLGKCNCQKRACTSTCEVKLEALSPTETLSSSTSCPSEKTIHDFKLENNNVKCESCSVGLVVGQENISCAANCNVKCESGGYKCEMMKCEQCMKEGQMAILELDKDSGILLIDEKRLDADAGVKEELNDVVVVDTLNWRKPDYEPIVQEVVDETEIVVPDDSNANIVEELPKCQKLTKRKLSLDSLSDGIKKRKVDKRTLSVGSTRDFPDDDRLSPEIFVPSENVAASVVVVEGASKKSAKKESQCQKRKAEGDSTACESSGAKKAKSSKAPTSNGVANSCFKTTASDTSIMETIDDVILQSVQMTQKKDRKCDTVASRVTDNKKKKGANLMSTIKKVTKKIELVKVAVTEKLSLAKSEAKITKDAINKCKIENKLKANKTQDAKCKSNKVKGKIVDAKTKIFDSKPRVADVKITKDVPKKLDNNNGTGGSATGGAANAIAESKSRVIEMCENVKRAALVKKKRKSTKKTTNTSCVKKAAANAACKPDDSEIIIENCSLAKKPFLKPKWSNGWSWEGDSYEAKVYLTNEESAIRRCYASMKHVSGDVLRPRDCVLLKSGQRKADLPFVAKIAALWENPDDGEMMFSLLWYYRPEHTEQGRTDYDTEDEVFASRHRDANSVACIEDKCYILTFNEYCRYRKNLRRVEEGLESPGLIVPPGEQTYPRECRQPPIPVPSDMVLFCRRVYDYRGKKLVKNPG